MTYASNLMKSTIEAVLKARGLLEQFNAADSEEGFHVRIQNAPYMDLVIERHGRQVTVTHYFEQNGDLIPDPDQEFEIIGDGSWQPVALQFAIGTYRRAVEVRDGKRFVSPGELRDQISFANMWAKNIRAQGYVG